MLTVRAACDHIDCDRAVEFNVAPSKELYTMKALAGQGWYGAPDNTEQLCPYHRLDLKVCVGCGRGMAKDSSHAVWPSEFPKPGAKGRCRTCYYNYRKGNEITYEEEIDAAVDEYWRKRGGKPDDIFIEQHYLDEAEELVDEVLCEH